MRRGGEDREGEGEGKKEREDRGTRRRKREKEGGEKDGGSYGIRLFSSTESKNASILRAFITGRRGSFMGGSRSLATMDSEFPFSGGTCSV